MSPPIYTCGGCGAQLSLDHLRGTDCPYCRAAFPHHARAVEHAALVQRVMHDNIAATSPWLVGSAPAPALATFGVASALTAAHVAQATLAARRVDRMIAVVVPIAISVSVLGVVLSALLLS